jgi:hypothetical protein
MMNKQAFMQNLVGENLRSLRLHSYKRSVDTAKHLNKDFHFGIYHLT